MENIIVKTKQEVGLHDLPVVRYVYKNSTRCRFNVYCLKNSNTFAEHLKDELGNQEGVYNVKPSIITGNVLIKYNQQSTTHSKIFFKLQKVARAFLKDTSISINKNVISSFLPQRNWMSYMYPAGNQPLNQCKRNCNSCTNRCFNYIGKSVNIEYFLSLAFKTTGSLILQQITEKFIRQSLYRLIF